jgi:hypothetical protein
MQSNNDSGDALFSNNESGSPPTNTDSLASPTDSDADNTIGKIHHKDSDDTSDASIMLIDESDRVSTDTAASLPLFPLRDNAAYANESKTKLPLSTYFIIAIPAFLDIASTALLIAGLKYLDVSIFQMISNSQVVFVALMKHYILKNLMCKFHLLINVCDHGKIDELRCSCSTSSFDWHARILGCCTQHLCDVSSRVR